MIKDFTINAIYYNIIDNKIEDPINGIKDLKNGIIRTSSSRNPYIRDPYRVLRTFKISGEFNIEITDHLRYYIYKDASVVKSTYLLLYDATIWSLTKMINSDYSLRAFHLIIKYNYLDVFIPAKNRDEFQIYTSKYSSLIENMAIISELIIKTKIIEIDIKVEKIKIYLDIFNQVFERSGVYKMIEQKYSDIYLEEKLNLYSNKMREKIKIYKYESIVAVSIIYCRLNDCEDDIFTTINLDLLKNVFVRMDKIVIIN